MSHEIKHDIKSERIGALLRKFVKEIIALAFAFPTVAIVAIVGRDDHDAAFVVVDYPDVHVDALLTTSTAPFTLAGMRLPCDAIVLAFDTLMHIGGLQFVHGDFEIEDAMEKR